MSFVHPLCMCTPFILRVHPSLCLCVYVCCAFIKNAVHFEFAHTVCFPVCVPPLYLYEYVCCTFMKNAVHCQQAHTGPFLCFAGGHSFPGRFACIYCSGLVPPRKINLTAYEPTGIVIVIHHSHGGNHAVITGSAFFVAFSLLQLVLDKKHEADMFGEGVSTRKRTVVLHRQLLHSGVSSSQVLAQVISV